ncbi:MAG: prepilin-type N-terminal cleavage/methylation domain-containing protein [Clostridiaceae bacterium]|nr:prepilin-type N-terminal cleavage/methylation domain-containing protein [Clostridiaceae bacterium]
MMKKYLNEIQLNNKGFTLLEAVIAILLIAIVSVGITSMFFSLSRISKLSEEQLIINAVIRVVKENVVRSIKTDTSIYATGFKASDADSLADMTLKNLPVKDLTDKSYPYVFDLTYDGLSNGVKKYMITIRKRTDGPVLAKYSIETYPD